MKKIIFRADASSEIGYGHFIRTLALADMLKDDYYCVFVTQTPTTYQINEIEKVCNNYIDIPKDESHFNIFLNMLKGDEIVVLDNYYFTTEYQLEIKNKGCKLVCIDDMHDKHYVADIVINYAIDQKDKFSVENSTNLLLGLEYALIRESFRTISINKKIQSSLLINFGGSDSYNITYNIIKFIVEKKINEIYSCYVLVGNANKFKESISEICKLNNIQYLSDLDEKKMNSLLESIEYAILPTSTISIEALAKNVTVLGGYYVENQIEFYNYLKGNDIIYPIGDFLNENNLKKIIDGLGHLKTNQIFSFLNIKNNLQKAFLSI